MKTAASKIWCEAVCSHCGALANNAGYYSPVRIKALKNELESWSIDADGSLLCDTCTEKKRKK